jgi:hypothetical protein
MRILPISKKTILATTAIAVALASASFAYRAYAQSPIRSYTITPPTLVAPLAPAKSSEGKMAIRNETDEPVTFNVTVQDFIVTDTKGTPTILAPDTLSNKYSAASWIGVSPTRFTVPGHGRQELSYYIQVPAGARPGGHYAAVVYSPVTEKGVDSTGATVNSQIGTLFSVSIAGPITEKAAVSKFFVPFFQEYGPIDVQTQIKNFGDEHIHPLGNITITSWFGKETQPLHENNVFPEAARDYVNIFGQQWMIGRYVATFQGTYGRNNNLPLEATVVFWVFPWKIVVVIILFIIAAALAYMLMKKKQNPPTHSEGSGQAQTGEVEHQAAPTQDTPSAQ